MLSIHAHARHAEVHGLSGAAVTVCLWLDGLGILLQVESCLGCDGEPWRCTRCGRLSLAYPSHSDAASVRMAVRSERIRRDSVRLDPARLNATPVVMCWSAGGLCQDCGEFCAECVSIDDCKVCHSGWVARDGKPLG